MIVIYSENKQQIVDYCKNKNKKVYSYFIYYDFLSNVSFAITVRVGVLSWSGRGEVPYVSSAKVHVYPVCVCVLSYPLMYKKNCGHTLLAQILQLSLVLHHNQFSLFFRLTPIHPRLILSLLA